MNNDIKGNNNKISITKKFTFSNILKTIISSLIALIVPISSEIIMYKKNDHAIVELQKKVKHTNQFRQDIGLLINTTLKDPDASGDTFLNNFIKQLLLKINKDFPITFIDKNFELTQLEKDHIIIYKNLCKIMGKEKELFLRKYIIKELTRHGLNLEQINKLLYPY